MKRLENIYEVTQRLCGVIIPLGEPNIDEVRLMNLADTIDLMHRLITDIAFVAKLKDRHEHSFNEASELASGCIDDIIVKLIDYSNFELK